MDGYTYDTFLSYAHVDDRPVPNAEDDKGWITIFYETLQIEVQNRLGRTDVELWKDDELSYHKSLTRQLVDTVRASAILIVMLSPGYIRSDWCGRERSAFMQAVRWQGDAPVFVVGKEWIADAAVPEELRDYRRFPFYSGSENDWATFGYPRPNPLDPRHSPFYDSIVKLSREISGVLHKLAAAPSSQPLVPPILVTSATAGRSGKRVLLAETTDDLERDRDMVRASLDQQGIEVLPPAGFYYPFEPKEFRAEFERHLRSADVFVQLLSGISGRRPAGVPQGYPRLQWEIASGFTEKQPPILQWCTPSLDIGAVRDEQSSGLLRLATVRQESLTDFQRAIFDALSGPDLQPATPVPSLVCVNVDSSDQDLAKQIQDILQRERTEFAAIWFGDDVPKNRELMVSSFRDCDGVIVVYGKAKDSWVDRQLLECRKQRAFRTRPFAALGIFEGAPPEQPDAKPPVNVYLDGLERYDCRGQANDSAVEREVKAFLARLRAGNQPKAA
ncbi:MAG: TIR domain-containing protein [Hyphomicrobiales bacterium]